MIGRFVYREAKVNIIIDTEFAALSRNDCAMIIEALRYAKRKAEDYEDYPSYEFKLGRIKVYDDLIAKVRNLQKEAK